MHLNFYRFQIQQNITRFTPIIPFYENYSLSFQYRLKDHEWKINKYNGFK